MYGLNFNTHLFDHCYSTPSLILQFFVQSNASAVFQKFRQNPYIHFGMIQVLASRLYRTKITELPRTYRTPLVTFAPLEKARLMRSLFPPI